MASASSDMGIPSASVPSTSQTIPWPIDHPLYEVEHTRDLIARRNRALDSLPMEEDIINDLEDALREVGWPVCLSKGGRGSQGKKAKNARYEQEDINALVCIKRFCIEFQFYALPRHLEPFFEYLNRVDWAHAWHDLVRAVSRRWKAEEYDKKLIKLYEGDKESFVNIVEQGFETFTERELQVAYVSAKKRYFKAMGFGTSFVVGCGRSICTW